MKVLLRYLFVESLESLLRQRGHKTVRPVSHATRIEHARRDAIVSERTCCLAAAIGPTKASANVQSNDAWRAVKPGACGKPRSNQQRLPIQAECAASGGARERYERGARACDAPASREGNSAQKSCTTCTKSIGVDCCGCA